LIEPVRDILDQGGWVLIAIIVASAVAWSLIVWEWLRLREKMQGGWGWIERAIDDVAHNRRVRIDRVDPSHRNLVGQLLRTGLKRGSHDRASFEAQVMPLLRSQALMLERPLRMIAVLAASMPLLGLLGTVLGMTNTFTALTDRDVAQVDAMAGGISQALVTTQAGLVVAVPVVLIHSVLSARVRRYVQTATTMIKRIETVVCRD